MKWLLIAFSLLASCTTAEKTLVAMRSLNRGKSADSFFIRNGPPKSGYRMASGGMIYTWEPPGSNRWVPGSTTATSSYEPDYFGGGGTMKTTLSQSGPYVTQARCQLQITTDSRDRITDIRANYDSIGPWTLSYIHDYFAEARKRVKREGLPPASKHKLHPVAGRTSGGTHYLQEP